MLDSGNALFRAAGVGDDAAQKRAAFIVRAMSSLGTAAMAVGTRDLSSGVPFLLEAAKGQKMKLLSANLRTGNSAPFEGSTVVNAGGVKVGVIGVSAVGPIVGANGVVGAPLVPAVRAELKRLQGKVDLTIVLSAATYADTMQLGLELKDAVDLYLQSSEARASSAQKLDYGLAIASGERGRAVGKLELALRGKGAWVDLEQIDREKQLLQGLESRLEAIKQRRALATDAAARKDLDGTISEISQRRAEQKKKVSAAEQPQARTAKLSWVQLDAKVGDDPALKQQVLEFEPTYAAPH